MGSAARTPGGRLTDDRGFALPIVMVVLMILALLVGAAILSATHSTDRAIRDESSARAFAAADAAADIATYRINKTIVPEILGVTDLKDDNGLLGGASPLSLTGLVQKSCAVKVGATAGPLTLSLIGSGNSWCSAASGTIDDGQSVPAQYAYYMGLGVDLGGGLVQRQVIAVGCVGNITTGVCSGVRRIQVTLRIQITGTTTLFKRQSYDECTAVVPSASSPSAGCPT